MTDSNLPAPAPTMDTDDKPLTAVQSDYLEIIYEEFLMSGRARGCTIAETAGVTRATVSATLRSLRTLGYIDYVPYGSIELTPTGLTKAKALRERRLTLERFFTDIFGTDPEIARKLADANKHGAPPKMLKGLSDLTGFIAENREAWEAFRRR